VKAFPLTSRTGWRIGLLPAPGNRTSPFSRSLRKSRGSLAILTDYAPLISDDGKLTGALFIGIAK
jgi:hypothetical protein